MANFYSTRGIGDLLGVVEWRVRRLYEAGILPEPIRFAGKRVIAGADIPAVVDALRDKGWLPSSDTNRPGAAAANRCLADHKMATMPKHTDGEV